MAHPRSACGAPPQGGAASGPAKPVPRRPLGRALTLAICTVAALSSSGCAVKPWVAPYERERLSDPVMQWSRTALADKHREHIHLVREGSRGATGVQGGGCGCN
ncbi:MAG: hypothetical protein C0505_03210 [Leptothrix sp. (in: Bacteria)]|nr:hypothetical protein [Leptothrix sp. (in: b-proteobacteria)]